MGSALIGFEFYHRGRRFNPFDRLSGGRVEAEAVCFRRESAHIDGRY